ncbi:MAG: hypothetical protein JSR69_18895 [Proteobacteria bacterium]|nr:hypothetical protein [Pseudomonadota bacterium]
MATSPVPSAGPLDTPFRRLGLALILSALAHLVALSAFTPGGDRRLPGNNAAALSATLVGRSAAAQNGTPPPAPSPPGTAADMPPAPPAGDAPRPGPAANVGEGDTAAPAAPTEATSPHVPAASRHIAARFIPVAELTRAPELISYVDEKRWPRLPGIHAGSFRLQLYIGADGVVKQVRPDCEEDLCEAARIYTEIVSEWRFLPGEVLGTQVPSQLTLEFQVKGDSGFPGIDQLPPRQ